MKKIDVNGKRVSIHTRTGTATKACTYCGKRKSRDKFVTGRMCIECKTKYDKARYLAKKDEIDARAKAYGKTERGYETNKKATRKYYGKHGYNGKTLIKGTPEYQDYLLKQLARNNVHYALKTGKLTKGVCEVCGEPEVHAHHDDYTKPLDVRWLCVKHHAILRRDTEGA